MPVYNNSSASLPYKPFGFPKNWQVEGEKVNTKFLNKWLHIIEEFGTDDFQKIFKLYQRAYFKDSLAKENYFKETVTLETIESHHKKYPNIPLISGSCGFIMNPSRFGSQVAGATLTCGLDQATNKNARDLCLAGKLSVGTIGEYYDQLKVKQVVGNTYNYKMAIYNDSSTAPANVEQQTGSIAGASSSYTYQSITSFALTTAQNWHAIKANNSSWSFRTANNTLANNRKYIAAATFVFPDPFGSPTPDGYPHLSELGHT